jgi:tetraacyldisaccharide 4'-kinase
VTIDATNPWGGSMLPLGQRREPLSGLARADCFVLTRTEETTDLSSITAELQKTAGQKPVFRSRMVTTGLRRLGGETIDQASSIKNPVGAFCGVGNPKSFFNHLGREGFELALQRAFPDHHNYQQSDVDQIVAEARAKGAVSILTTAKDAVKLSSLHFEIPCYVLEIKISIDDEAQLIQMIRNQVAKYSQSKQSS